LVYAFVSRGASFVQQRRGTDHICLAALAAFRSDIIRVDVAAAVGAEIILGPDEGPRIGDGVDHALVEALGRNRLSEKLGDAGVAGGGHPLLVGMAGEHDDGDVRVGIGAGLADHLRELEAIEDRHRPVGDDDVRVIVREGLEPGGAVFGLIDVARAEAVQQRAQNPAHVRVVVDDEEMQAVEVDADHATSGGRPIPEGQADTGAVNARLSIAPWA
jgi:hypothetical protein